MPDDGSTPQVLGRRALLRCGAFAACAPALAQLPGCAPRIDVPRAVAVGAPQNELLQVPLSRVPELARPGGAVLLHADARDAIGRPLSVLVAQTTAAGLRAWDAYCPHAGCEVAWVDAEDEVVCPCHLSRFALDGSVVHPPARAAIDSYPARLDAAGTTLIVDLAGVAGIFPAAQGGLVQFAVSLFPALAQAGGSVTGRSLGVPFPLVVVRASPAQVAAFDARCTHLGCTVVGVGDALDCPCHGSVFGLDGSVRNGPATRPLAALPVQFDGATVSIRVA